MGLIKFSQRRFGVLMASEWVILTAWAAAFWVIRSHSVMVYLIVPVLAVFTFALLSQFSMILWALFLSAYVDVISVEGVGQGSVQLLIGLIWLAAGVTWLGRQVTPPLIATQPDVETSKVNRTALSVHLRHDLLTPVKMIQGFCEILLTSSTDDATREPVLPTQRKHIESIYRNSQQLQRLIDKLFDPPVSTQLPTSADPDLFPDKSRKLLVLLDESGTATDSFRSTAVQVDFVTASSVTELRGLSTGTHPAAVFVNSADVQAVPQLTDLFGAQTPIVTFELATSHAQLKARGVQRYLAKPVQAETLFAALQSLDVPLRKVLIIDDNIDSAALTARMFQAMPEPPRLWTANTGREALALLRQPIDPDVILMDFMLPDMNGLALVDQLRAEAHWSAIPILMVSAYRLEDLLDSSLITHATIVCKAGVPITGLISLSECLKRPQNP